MHATTWSVCSGFKTSCARGDTIYASVPCKLTMSSHLFARWHLFRHVGYLRHQQQVDLWPFDLESGVRFTCDVGYLCANFSLPRPLCSRLKPDVRDRETSDVSRRQTKASLNASALWSGGIITSCARSRHNMPRPCDLVLFDLESGVRVTCDVGYLCGNFSLP